MSDIVPKCSVAEDGDPLFCEPFSRDISAHRYAQVWHRIEGRYVWAGVELRESPDGSALLNHCPWCGVSLVRA